MRKTREFQCVDEDGNTYTVQEWQSTGKHKPLSGASRTTLGRRNLRTATGKCVVEINENTFNIIETDTLITRI